MSRLKFRIYGSDTELVDYCTDSSNTLEFDFCEDMNGFVQIGESALRLSGGKCIFDLRLIENGEYTPRLMVDKRLVNLPVIKKFGNLVECIDCTDEYIRAASQRERALERKVLELEEKIRLLDEKVFGTVVL